MAQSQSENEVINLSKAIFKWEVENKFDSLGNLMTENFKVVSSSGAIQNKKEYLERLTSGNFFHKRIDVEQNIATINTNTATVVGKGTFVVVVSGKEATLHLSYMKVFTRNDSKQAWKLMALYASRLPE